MSQQQTRYNHDDDDEELEPLTPAQRVDQDEVDRGTAEYDDKLLAEMDQLLLDAPEWKHFQQKGGQ